MVYPKIIGMLLVMGLTSAFGIASPKINDLVARTEGPDQEVQTAQLALADAMGHLQKVRSPESRRNIATIDFVKRAQKELRYEDGAGP